MLNRFKLAQELEQLSGSLFCDLSHEYAQVCTSWDHILNDQTFATKVQKAHVSWSMPTWLDELDTTIPVVSLKKAYCTIAVDGSQIYPDRHQGSLCSLINIGSVILKYQIPGKAVICDSVPYLVTGNDDFNIPGVSLDIINCRREELELDTGLTLSIACKQEDAGNPLVFLFDGSLIFWHLEAKDPELRYSFMVRYCTILQSLFEKQILCAGYISLPRSKELVNLLRFALYLDGYREHEAFESMGHVIDTHIVKLFLKPGMRSTVFKHRSKIIEHYPEQVQPHFFYLHVGNEIVRIEIPAWIAFNNEYLALISGIIHDQVEKGYGYPVALAEAHEQAVIKGPDRDFFYHLLTKVSMEYNHRLVLSQKNVKKRGLGI